MSRIPYFLAATALVAAPLAAQTGYGAPSSAQYRSEQARTAELNQQMNSADAGQADYAQGDMRTGYGAGDQDRRERRRAHRAAKRAQRMAGQQGGYGQDGAYAQGYGYDRQSGAGYPSDGPGYDAGGPGYDGGADQGDGYGDGVDDGYAGGGYGPPPSAGGDYNRPAIGRAPMPAYDGAQDYAGSDGYDGADGAPQGGGFGGGYDSQMNPGYEQGGGYRGDRYARPDDGRPDAYPGYGGACAPGDPDPDCGPAM